MNPEDQRLQITERAYILLIVEVERYRRAQSELSIFIARRTGVVHEQFGLQEDV